MTKRWRQEEDLWILALTKDEVLALDELLTRYRRGTLKPAEIERGHFENEQLRGLAKLTWMVKAGITREENAPGWRQENAERRARAIAMLDAGHTLTEVAREFGRCKTTVAQWRDQAAARERSGDT